MADQTTTSTTSLPEIYRPAIEQYVNTGLGFANSFLNGNRQLPQFDPGSVIPGFNWLQNATTNPAYNMASGQSGGMQTVGAANNYLQGTMGGQYLNHQTGANPYSGTFVQPGMNPYMGQDNPYLQNTINKTLGDMTQNYRTGTAAQLDAAAARAGAFGGSGHTEAVGRNEKVLGDSLGNAANQLRFQDYMQQIGLQENAINRAVQTQTEGLQRNAGLEDARIGRNDALWNSERSRMNQAAGLGPGQVGAEAASLDPAMRIGELSRGIDERQRQFGMNQDLRTMFPELFVLDTLRGIIPGQTGGTTTSSTSGGGDTNKWAQILGGLGLAGGLYGSFK
jgi:hypothetical protein